MENLLELTPAPTKNERLNQVIETMVDKLPPTVKPMVQMMGASYLTSVRQLQDSDIDSFIEQIRGVMDYVEFGELTEPGELE